MSSPASPDPWSTKSTTPQATPDVPGMRAEEFGLKSGDRLGSYQLLTLLGKGGMGMVFRARHLRLKKEFALKVLSPRFARDQDAIRRFERETEALGRLEHVHLVRASDAGVENGVPYVVMELLDGANLAELTKQHGAWPIAEACEAVRQAALGLQHAFERGLVHRDIKPSNLWLTPAGVVKVLDLGLARLYGDESNAQPMTAAGVWMGTPDYIAPEQILDSHTADIRADLYGLGCTLFHLLTGEPPFGNSTHPTLRQKSEAHLKEPPPGIRQRRPDVPAGLDAVLARLLAKRPEDRYQTPAEAATELKPFTRNARLGGLLTPEWQTQSTLSSRDVETNRQADRKLAASLTIGRRSCSLTLVLGLAAAVFIGLPIWWYLHEPGAHVQKHENPKVATNIKPLGPVQVEKMEVTHYPTVNGARDMRRIRVLGKGVFSTNLNDSVTVECRLSRPAYAFLIAFRPDGTPDVCFPEKDDEPPPLTDKPSYPSDSKGYNYGLQEGTGLQVFALVASSKPLPSFKEWWAKHPGCPWKRYENAPAVVWRADGIDDVEALTEGDPSGQRSKRIEVPGKTLVAQLAKWLRSAPQVDAVQVLGFAVLPKDKR